MLVILFISSIVKGGHQTQVNESIIVIYSALTDFNSNGILQILHGLNFTTDYMKIDFFELNGAGCSDQSVFAVKVLIESGIFQGSGFKAVVGPSCSNAAYAIARLIKRSNISVRHFYTAPLPASLAAEVSNTSVGLLPPVDLLAEASVALIKYANWTEVLALYQPTDIDMNYIFINFQEQLESSNAQCMEEGSSSTERIKTRVHVSPLIGGTIHLDKVLHSYSVRIIFVMLDAESVTRVLCDSFELEAFYPDYQWIIVKTTIEDIVQSLEHGICGKQKILKVLDNALFVNFESRVQKISFITGNRDNSNTILLYKNSIEVLLAMLDSNISASNLDFLKVSGFPKRAYIFQLQSNKSVDFLVYSNCVLSTEDTYKNVTLISSRLRPVISTVYLPLGVIFITINVTILLICAALHFLTLLYWYEHSVKSSSPLLLHISYIGIYMVNLTTAVYFIQKTIPITSDFTYINLCRFFLTVSSIGMTLILGSLMVKTWRLYKIFIYFTDPGNFLSDKSLASFVVCLTLVDIAICFVWFLFDPLERQEFEVHRNNTEGTRTIQDVCESRAYPEMLTLLIFYQIVIVAMMMHLMCKLRKKIPKRHKNLRSTSVIRLGFLIVFGLSFGIPGYTLSHYYLRAIEFEFTMLGVLFDSLQVFFIALLFIPPLRPVLRRMAVYFILKCQTFLQK